MVKGVIFCGASATDWKVNTFTTSEEIVFSCHGNTKKIQATHKPSKSASQIVLPVMLLNALVPQQHILEH